MGSPPTGITVEAVTFRNRPGASLTIADLTEFAAAVGEHLDGTATGCEYPGHDTIENAPPSWTCFTPGTDGPANLLAAITVAASTGARGLGCLVVMADEIHAARRVRKAHSTSTATFTSAIGGPLGYVVEGQAQFLNSVLERQTVPAPTPDAPAVNVGLYTATFGDAGTALKAVVGGRRQVGHCRLWSRSRP